jgi:hypothetical protein
MAAAEESLPVSRCTTALKSSAVPASMYTVSTILTVVAGFAPCSSPDIEQNVRGENGSAGLEVEEAQEGDK